MTAPENANASGATEANAEENTKSNATLPPHQGARNHDKRLTTLIARAALAGVTLYAIDDDDGKTVFIVSRWALTRELDSLDAVEAWLNLVTGA